jgi:hypothetical protein
MNEGCAEVLKQINTNRRNRKLFMVLENIKFYKLQLVPAVKFKTIKRECCTVILVADLFLFSKRIPRFCSHQLRKKIAVSLYWYAKKQIFRLPSREIMHRL